jgi:hypothetical protein
MKQNTVNRVRGHGSLHTALLDATFNPFEDNYQYVKLMQNMYLLLFQTAITRRYLNSSHRPACIYVSLYEKCAVKETAGNKYEIKLMENSTFTLPPPSRAIKTELS